MNTKKDNYLIAIRSLLKLFKKNFLKVETQLFEIKLTPDEQIKSIQHIYGDKIIDPSKDSVVQLMKDRYSKLAPQKLVTSENKKTKISLVTDKDNKHLKLVFWRVLKSKIYSVLIKSDTISNDVNYDNYHKYIQTSLELIESKVKQINNVSTHELQILLLKNYLQKTYGLSIGINNRIIDLVNAFERRRFEDNPINIGFIFTNDLVRFRTNNDYASTHFEFDYQFDSDNFNSYKNLWPISDGIKTFLVINKDKIVGLFTSLNNINNKRKRYKAEEKIISDEDVIVSILNGDVSVVKGNEILFEKESGSIKIRNIAYLKKILKDELSNILENKDKEILINLFEEILFSLSDEKQGGIFVIGNNSSDILNYHKINISNYENIYKNPGKESKIESYINSVSKLSKADGAVLINNKFEVYGFSATLPSEDIDMIQDVSQFGKRHAASIVYSYKNKDCIVITISKDGPISIFKHGLKIASM